MSTFVSFVTSVLGVYTPVVDAAGNVPAGCAGVNWLYVACAALLVITIYSILRILGSMICKIF